MAADGISQSTVQLFCSEEGWVAGWLGLVCVCTDKCGWKSVSYSPSPDVLVRPAARLLLPGVPVVVAGVPLPPAPIRGEDWGHVTSLRQSQLTWCGAGGRGRGTAGAGGRGRGRGGRGGGAPAPAGRAARASPGWTRTAASAWWAGPHPRTRS